MSRPWSSRNSRSPRSFIRINGRIRAREVRVVGSDGQQDGVMPTPQALTLARAKCLDLVEVASAARPPVCRIVDYGKYRYEQSKKERENRKHQHINRIKDSVRAAKWESRTRRFRHGGLRIHLQKGLQYWLHSMRWGRRAESGRA